PASVAAAVLAPSRGDHDAAFRRHVRAPAAAAPDGAGARRGVGRDLVAPGDVRSCHGGTRMNAGAADLRLEKVFKNFGAVVAVRDVSLAIARGTIVSLLGPSGCGKTTTLRLIAGFEQPSQGDVYIRGQRVTGVPPYRRDFGMVFQSYALFPHLSVA